MTKVMPELEGKFHGIAIRVPVPNVSLIDLTVVTHRSVSIDAINAAFREVAGGSLRNIVAVSDFGRQQFADLHAERIREAPRDGDRGIRLFPFDLR